ncbi:hypothetical protein ABFS83_02G154100 [Erythranthe nasuta]
MAKPIINALLLFFFIISLSWQKIDGQQKTWQDAFKVLGIAWNKDGTSLNRTIQIPMVDPTPYDDGTTTPAPIALSQDIQLTASSKASVRLYIPTNPPKNKKLPLIIYFHGGDFVLFSATTVIFHNFCNEIASQLPAVVVSVEYRLAPENRLPAAYEDAMNALIWVKNQSLEIGGRDPWLEYADFKNVHLLGSSAGANIAYNAAVRAFDLNLHPLQIKGLLLNQAFFGGVQRTQSEGRLKDDPYVPLYVNDVLWTLALPKNAGRNHEYCNPVIFQKCMGRIYDLPKVYVKGDYGDPLVDRSVQLVQFLKKCNVKVYSRFKQGGFHGIELQNKAEAQLLYNDIKWFVNDVPPVGAGIQEEMPVGVSYSGHASQ